MTDTLDAFGQDPWWMSGLKALAIFILVVLLVLFTIWFERRVVARMQVRPGPNRNGPFGLLQSLADGLKLAFKEDLTPRTASKVVFVLAPMIMVVCAFTAFSVIPFGPVVNVFGVATPLQLADFPVAVLLILATSAVGVYGVVLGGWASGSTYGLLGSLRAAAQVISYEIGMGLSVLAVFLTAGTLSTSGIIEEQRTGPELVFGDFTITLPGWYALILFPSFVVFVISIVGETNRAPFDLPEAESELVAGFMTEYSSLKYALFFLAEYANMIVMSALGITLFLGGWTAPFPESWWPAANEGFMPLVWFFGKLLCFLFLFVWLRGTLPRFRYDQFMRLGWKVIVPGSLVWVMVLAAIRLAVDQPTFSAAWIGLLGGGVLVGVLSLLYWPMRKEYKEPAEPDTGMGGFPVPPMDLEVPPTSRIKQITAERETVSVDGGSADDSAGKEG